MLAMLVTIVFLLAASPAIAEQLIHVAGVTASVFTCDSNDVCVDLVAEQFNAANSSRASYQVIDRGAGTFLVPPTIVTLPPGALSVNPRATTATLRISGVDVTWTSSGAFTVAEDINATITDDGVVRKTSWRRLSNEAFAVGVIQGVVFTSGPLPRGDITRLSRREK